MNLHQFRVLSAVLRQSSSFTTPDLVRESGVSADVIRKTYQQYDRLFTVVANSKTEVRSLTPAARQELARELREGRSHLPPPPVTRGPQGEPLGLAAAERVIYELIPAANAEERPSLLREAHSHLNLADEERELSDEPALSFAVEVRFDAVRRMLGYVEVLHSTHDLLKSIASAPELSSVEELATALINAAAAQAFCRDRTSRSVSLGLITLIAVRRRAPIEADRIAYALLALAKEAAWCKALAVTDAFWTDQEGAVLETRFTDSSAPPTPRTMEPFRSLGWLPPVPKDWGERLRAVGGKPADAALPELMALANARLDMMGTIRLDRRLRGSVEDTVPESLATKPVRLAILSSSTADHLLPGIRVGALRRGIFVSTYVTGYGQYSQELMDPRSGLHAFGPDTVLFALDSAHVVGRIGHDMSDEAVDAALEAICDNLVLQWRAARSAFGCRVIQQSLLPVFPALFGSNEHRLATSPGRLVDRLNARLRDLADAAGIDLLALDTRVAQEGLGAWHDPALWHRAKQEVHPRATVGYGDLVGRLLAAQQGRSAKCLVLDLDNTLWGGVIGDDGLDGIVLGQGSARGEAFVAFQSYVLALSKRGVILAVCSKNDEANALEPFDKHPEMVLRRSDIACFAANWTDKAANLREIAERLNIGIDSLVFADDNPFERTIIRRELPMVGVPELPEEPALYAACLAEAGYFEGLHLTAEDRERNRQYQLNVRRESLKASTTDLEGYLRSLEMVMQWSPFDRVGLQRVVQLVNKTNQFNLTARRTSEEAVLALMADPRCLTLQIRLLDQFGDNGIIAIVVGRPEARREMVIDTWLVSNRVLGRQVEEATLNLIVSEAERLGVERLIGEYRPTEKNGMVKDHYQKLGFAPLESSKDGRTRWVLEVGGYRPMPTFIRSESVSPVDA